MAVRSDRARHRVHDPRVAVAVTETPFRPDADEWREIAAALAWSITGHPHDNAQRDALARYDAAVLRDRGLVP